MLKKIKKRLKNQKGFTLIELLAVIVILGIIAAIAIPAISGIIGNSKKDAHIANAEQMISAARTSIAANDPIWNTDSTVTLDELENTGYLEPVKSPGSADYSKSKSTVTRSEVSTGSGTYNYTVHLTTSDTDAAEGLVLDGDPSDPTDVSRDTVEIR
ncbi:prepilin-type N-terminal cleavage/methylation domain-containing protein [Neobacillus sp. LXY-4]|uniref:prepilin-type N-terminal cleavage/methylation domain-containing protein n=1 Tax=Neobacillus sp. LXY-4 TaxID=3379826 RepID=UPI003EE35E25